MKKKHSLLVFLVVVMMILGTACSAPAAEEQPQENEAPSENPEEAVKPADEQIGGELILATTTSTENSGLLDYILPNFEEKTGIDVKVVAVGTGAALQKGRDGEADALLVHAKSSEEQFVADGHGPARFDVMYNDFIIIGPESDPAAVKGMKVVEALTTIQESKSVFVSRGDNSGTNKKEIQLWDAAELQPEGDWYVSAGKGMGDTINMTNELLGYTMTDRATYLSMKENIDLKILVEGDDILFNQYGVIAVDPSKNDNINSDQADAFVKWILSEETQTLIGGFVKYDEVLFTPNAK